MDTVLYVTGAVLIGIALTILWMARNRRKRRTQLKVLFGTVPKQIYRQADWESIASYWRLKEEEYGNAEKVDDLTWDDLDMDQVFTRINAAQSSVGEETLYAMLRLQRYDADRLNDTERLIRYFEDHESERIKMQMHLSRLGKMQSNGLAEFLFHPAAKKLRFRWVYPILSAAAIISFAAIFFNRSVGLAFFLLIMTVNIVLYYRTKLSLLKELSAVRYLFGLLKCADKVSKSDVSVFREEADALRTWHRPIRMVAALSKWVLSDPSSEMDYILEYLKMIVLGDFVFYNFLISSVTQHTENCLHIYETIGRLDAAISIASYRKSVGRYCIPEFSDDDALVFTDVTHPLLRNAASNSLTLKKNALITGSNASGKSTFVKSVAVNMILAQTIHTCMASSVAFRPSFVVSSMAVRDDLETGESYFIAELNSLKRVLHALNEDVRCAVFIDEILKGTNTVERIAASAAMLRYLHGQNCIALVATHDMELTEIVGELCANYHFRESVTDDGVVFDYQIHDGPSRTKNAIRLLSFMGYPQTITERAEALAHDFETSGKWRVIE